MKCPRCKASHPGHITGPGTRSTICASCHGVEPGTPAAIATGSSEEPPVPAKRRLRRKTPSA